MSGSLCGDHLCGETCQTRGCYVADTLIMERSVARNASGEHDAERAAILSMALPAIRRFAQPLGVRVELVDLIRDVPRHQVPTSSFPFFFFSFFPAPENG